MVEQVPISASPDGEHPDNIYSNFDHELDTAVAERMKHCPGEYAPHPAWNFHGRIWYKDGRWREQVWVHGAPRAEYESESIKDLIQHVVGVHGSE